MKFLPLVCAALLFASLPAVAADGCYTKAEVDAEQLLRLHSELMVITVTCKYGSHGQNLVSAYTGFTNKNLTAIREAEQTMIGYYKDHGGDSLSKLDTLRTRLGNEFGQKIAEVSAPAFCEKNRDKVLLMSSYNPEYVTSEVEAMKVSAKTYIPECKEKMKLVGKN